MHILGEPFGRQLMAYALGHGFLINFVGDRCELQPLTDIIDESGGLVSMLPALRGTAQELRQFFQAIPERRVPLEPPAISSLWRLNGG